MSVCEWCGKTPAYYHSGSTSICAPCARFSRHCLPRSLTKATREKIISWAEDAFKNPTEGADLPLITAFLIRTTGNACT